MNIPDFDQFTEGKDLADAMAMARDCIEMAGCYLEDEHREIPAPFSKPCRPEKDELLSLVDVDFESYRRRHADALIRKNMTIPEYLDEYGRIEGLNFSKVLTDALIQKLKIDDGHAAF